jgi:tRNA-uridine 2-sulfurtransferase
MRFPVGGLTKSETRALAAEAGLPVANKADSQDLCFLAGTDRARFLSRHGGLSAQAGSIVDRDGTVLAQHRGHHGYTVGQRKGIGVQAHEPLYVLDKDAARNRVIVGPRPALETTRITLRDVSLHRPAARVDRVKLRYRSKPLPAMLGEDAAAGEYGALAVELAEPVYGAAPGQLACLMDGEVIVGRGTIARR